MSKALSLYLDSNPAITKTSEIASRFVARLCDFVEHPVPAAVVLKLAELEEPILVSELKGFYQKHKLLQSFKDKFLDYSMIQYPIDVAERLICFSDCALLAIPTGFAVLKVANVETERATDNLKSLRELKCTQLRIKQFRLSGRKRCVAHTLDSDNRMSWSVKYLTPNFFKHILDEKAFKSRRYDISLSVDVVDFAAR